MRIRNLLSVRAIKADRRLIALGIALALLISLLPLSSALAGSLVLEVRNWTRDSQSGLVTYDLNLVASGADENRGPCATACTWKVEAYFGSGDSASYVTRLGKGSGAPSFSQSLTATNVSMPEVTHIRAELYPYYYWYGRYDTGYVQVASPTSGGIKLEVNKWDRNLDSGLVSYDLAMNYWGAGKWNGPCHSSCNWSVRAFYSDGTSEPVPFSSPLGEGSAGGWAATKILAASDTYMKEVTHLRAKLTPYYSGYETFDTGLIQVASPVQGGITLGVNRWVIDEGNSVTYDLDVDAWNAGRWRGPCESACLWKIEAWSGTDPSTNPVATISDGSGGGWTLHTNASGSKVLNGVTHLRAKLYGYYSGYDSFETELIFVGNHMVNDDDVVPYEAALSPALLASPSTFCDRLAVAGGALPSTDGDSVPDAWQRCVQAIQLYGPVARKVLLAVATAAGGALALDHLIDEHANQGPVPTEDEQQNPPPRWQPTPDWEDNFCFWDGIVITEFSRTHMQKEGHLWASRRAGKSWFYWWVNWEILAQKYGPTVMPVPDPVNELNCRREITYWRDVGIDRNGERPTRVFTLITRKSSGEVVTMFPGTNP